MRVVSLGDVFLAGVMLKGAMKVVEDQKTKARLWRETDTVYYKGGVSAPDYCVLKFTAGSGHLYLNFTATDFAI